MAVLSISLIYFLRDKISSLIDPLLIHLIWCASGMALLIGYFFTNGLSLDGLSFISVYIIYVIGLFRFLNNTSQSYETLRKSLYDDRNFKLFVVSLILNIVSRYEFFTYAISHPAVIEWFLYKFKQTEERSFAQYILQIGARPFFIYYTFILLKTKPKWRVVIVVILLGNVLLDVFAGGRSAIIGLIVAYGYFVHRFRPFFSEYKLKKLNRYSIIFIASALVIGSVVTSFYSKEATIKEGMMSMVNRLLAAGDGLEMYLANNASEHIESGVGEYIKSAFGIFIKRVVDIQTQSVGWKLYELENGVISSIAVGPNYILPLQALVLGKIFIPIYPLLISFIVAFLRGNRYSRKLSISQDLSFVLGLISFEPALDVELFVLVLAACLSIYLIFIYPVRKIKFLLDWHNIISFPKHVNA
ncbi:hypothetical protein M0L20_10615 [Spirosoma sp. RP8]|uniref:Oligosaccharide repeat unit polymerase n=1 Tax=Spirosoma liriopis TaxID=2937440 RepID=A0ABT0HJG1_9BACT|nr:hypothetical protein [Spirosoma liriopis]MCK8492302.1 hypothetical protein [Spirosoma liriopis]